MNGMAYLWAAATAAGCVFLAFFLTIPPAFDCSPSCAVRDVAGLWIASAIFLVLAGFVLLAWASLPGRPEVAGGALPIFLAPWVSVLLAAAGTRFVVDVARLGGAGAWAAAPSALLAVLAMALGYLALALVPPTVLLRRLNAGGPA